MKWRQITAALALLLIGPVCGQAQSDTKVATEADIRAADETFWKAYNACDFDGMAPFLTEDVEFYHDKTGLTRTRKAVIDSLRNGVCANPAMHIRREAIAGTVSYHRLADAGAILLGQHRFYVNEEGKPERLDGQANFTHIWVWANGRWRMSRILSYDHGPPAYTPPDVIAVHNEELQRYAGVYKGPHSGDIFVRVDASHLQLKAGSMELSIYPQSQTIFFAKERDLRFEFVLDQDGSAKRLIVRENGSLVEEADRTSHAGAN